MRGPPMLEAQARTAGRASRTFRVRDAQEHFLSFLEVAPGVRGEDAPRERALPGQLRVRQLRVVLGALLRGENGADLLAGGLANAGGLYAALAIAESAHGQAAHLLARVLEN